MADATPTPRWTADERAVIDRIARHIWPSGGNGQVPTNAPEEIFEDLRLAGVLTAVGGETRQAWLELARRITASERIYRDLADEHWRDWNVHTAIRYRGIAEGLDMARNHQVELAKEGRRDDPA